MKNSRFARRVYTPDERAWLTVHNKPQNYAGLFAAKEAAIKACGGHLLDYEITHTSDGKPQISRTANATHSAGGSTAPHPDSRSASECSQTANYPAVDTKKRDAVNASFNSESLTVSISHCHTFAVAVVILSV
jgi:phosphopantetheine--protein transferase-like protein